MDFKIATKYNKQTEGQSCPNCRYIFKDFLDLGEKLGIGPDILWICLDCGLIFMPKKARLGIKDSIRGLIQQQMKMKQDMEEAAYKVEVEPPIPTHPGEPALAPEVAEKLNEACIPKFGCPNCDFKAKSKAGLAAHGRKHKGMMGHHKEKMHKPND